MDEVWIEEAIERYRRVERLLSDFDKAIAKVDVTVRSPDGLVQVVVAADGTIRDVMISESGMSRSARDLSSAVRAAVAAAADAASWARTRLHRDMFGDWPRLADGGDRALPANPRSDR